MLRITRLKSGYSKQTSILNDLSLHVRKGEFIALLGPNGSGKTTFIRSVLGQIPIHSGRVEIDGRVAESYSTVELAKVAAVLTQENEMGMDFTVEEIVLLGRYPYQGKGFLNQYKKEDYDIVQKCLALTNTQTFKGKLFSSLSGGEKQRVLLAKALAQEPQLLFLDEPTNHLDVKHTIELLDLLKRLQREKKLTVVAVLHDLNMAALYADRFALLKNGEIIADGGVELMFEEDLLSSVYGVSLLSRPHPLTNKPQIFFTPSFKED